MKTIREEKFGSTTIRLLADKSGFKGTFIRDGKLGPIFDDEDADVLWTRLINEYGKLHPDYFGWNGAISRFSSLFPDGFPSARYKEHERTYKMNALTTLSVRCSIESALSGSGDAEGALAAFRDTNMLASFEQMRVTDLLQGPNAEAFLQYAAEFTLHRSAKALENMVSLASKHDAAKWPIMTYLPFFWKPETEMYLKPEVTKDFSTRVGHYFHDIYASRPDIETYSALIDLAEQTSRKLSALEPVDNIDIQSFIWVVGAYDDSELPDNNTKP